MRDPISLSPFEGLPRGVSFDLGIARPPAGDFTLQRDEKMPALRLSQVSWHT